MAFLELPVLVIENIFSYLSYDEIAKNRLVSKDFNEICMRLLNRGFLMIERRHAMALKSVKAQLPRRESERRYHPLARHCDILTSIETRISMLNMTYTKFIDNGICSFIPGKVIDEIRRVLSIVESSKTPPRAHEVLQELRDISSMAIEHFDDKISPAFRKLLQEGSSQPCPRPAQGTVDFSEDASIICAKFFDDRFNNEETAVTPMAIRQEMQHLRRRSVLNVKLSLYLAAQYKKYHNRMLDYKRFALAQHQTIRKMSKRQKQQYHEIADLKKRIEECDIKYSELTHTNQAAGGKAIAGNSSGSASGSQPLRHFGSQIKLDLSVLPIGTSKRHHSQALPNIKPRKPQIKLPSLSEDQNPKPDPNPAPSTSNQSPRTKSKSTMAKILGITNEIRHLSNLSKNFEGQLKRLADTEQEDMEAKKLKLD